MPGRTPGPTGVTVLTAGQARDVKQVKRNSVVRTIYTVPAWCLFTLVSSLFKHYLWSIFSSPSDPGPTFDLTRLSGYNMIYMYV